MSFKSRILSAFSFVGLIAITTSAQENTYNEVSIASPNAASLGKYADIPVNNHTGIPSINLPVYTVTKGSLSLPISLSYHAGGIKVMEPASWVGTGWSLNAGGVITRSVRGAPDEKFTSTIYSQEKGHFSDYGFSSYSFYDFGTEAPNFLAGRFDGEPDMFSFNVAGLTGKFYFRDDRTAVFEPQQDIKLEYDYEEGVGSIKSFILTAPNGTRYHFGKKNDVNGTIPVEITNTVTAQSGYTEGKVVSSWYLSKIESSDGINKVELNYTPEQYSYYTISMFPLSPDDYRMNSSLYESAPYIPQLNEYNLIKNVIKGVRLTEIKYSNGKVTFVPKASAREDLGDYSTNSFTPEVINDDAKALGEIKIENNGNACRKFIFEYNYFTDNTALQGYFAGYNIFTDKKRLKLLSLQEVSCDGSINNPPHEFDYFTEQLPRRLSFGQDHWGFYNGITNNTKLIPGFTENEWTEFPGANRDPAWPAMRGGALKKITYPTGGYSLFEFEANDTWAESIRYNDVAGPTVSVGYGNPNNHTYEQLHTFNNTPYTFYLSNASQGSTAGIIVYDRTDVNNPSNEVILSLSADAGESKQITRTFPTTGSYMVVLTKSNIPSSTQGASAQWYQKIAYNYARNEMVGGLRVKTLTHNDGSFSPDIITDYSYMDDASLRSTGILYSRPSYVQLVRSDEIMEAGYGGPFGTGPPGSCSANGCIDCDMSVNLSYFKSPCGIRPLSTSQGNHIGYNQVKVSQTGNGYSIFKYFGSAKFDAIIDDVAIRNINTKTPCTTAIPNYPYAPEPYDPKRGELKFECHYNESGEKMREVIYDVSFAEEAITTPGRLPGSYKNWQFTTYYTLKPIRKISHSSIEKLYTTPTAFSTTTNVTEFGSPYHYQPTRKYTTGSESELIETKFKYAVDYRNGDCEAISDCFNSYATSVGTITMQYYTDKQLCTTNGCVWNNYQDFKRALAQARRDYLECRLEYQSTVNLNGYQYCRLAALNSAGAELKPIYELQRRNMLMPIEITEWKAGNLIKATFNRFDIVTNPSGMVYIDKTQLLQDAAPINDFTISDVAGNTITKDSRYKDEIVLKFDNGNLVQMIKKDGVINTFLWGYNSQYPVAKIINATFDIAKTYITQSVLDAPGSDAGLRTHLENLRNIPGAFVTTYTYDPIVGITSETDPSGKTIYYQYDKLNRLVIIRDKDSNIIKKLEYKYDTANQD